MAELIPAPRGNQNAREHGDYLAKTKAALPYLKEITRLVKNMELSHLPRRDLANQSAGESAIFPVVQL